MVKRLWLPVLGAVCILLMGAGGGSYDGGGYATSRGGYVGGGAAVAALDTVTLLFTTEPDRVLDGVTTPTADADSSFTKRFVALRDSIRAIHDAGGPDSVYTLGVGEDVTEFAWCRIDSAYPAGAEGSDGDGPFRFHQYDASPRILVDGLSRLDVRWPVGSARSATLDHIPVENYVPAGSHIVHARLYCYNQYPLSYGQGDTTVTVLMTGADDSHWYGSKGLTGAANYAHASWRRQQSTNGGDPDWAASNDYEWDMTAREYYWDWGDAFDWSGSPTATTVPAGDGLVFDRTNCVQAAVNGSTNNGFFVTGFTAATSNENRGFWGWDADATSENMTPYLEVQYITKKYVAPFPGGKDWAFVFETDDGRAPNTVFADTLEAHGGKMTAYIARRFTFNSSDTDSFMDVAQLIAMHDAGHEIGSHSKYHNAAANGRSDGLAYWAPADTAAAQWDSLLVDTSPQFLYNWATDAGRADLISSARWGKSLGSPVASYSPYSMLAAWTWGYDAYRALYAENEDVNSYYELVDTAQWRASDTDIAHSGIPSQNQRMPRNMMLYSLTIGAPELFGHYQNLNTTEAELDSVRHNMKRAVCQAIANKTRVVSLFAHASKEAPFSYTAGLPGYADLGAVCDVVDDMGGRYMTSGELARWFKQWATPVATSSDYLPSGYAQDDSFKFDADDNIWYRPDGIGESWIRGLK